MEIEINNPDSNPTSIKNYRTDSLKCAVCWNLYPRINIKSLQEKTDVKKTHLKTRRLRTQRQ